MSGMPAYDGPPLMLNRGFFDSRENLLKIVEIVLGITTALFNNFCFPHWMYTTCRGGVFSATQLFSILVVNVFCVVMTALITLANLLGFYDAFYRYNLPLLERFLVTLFAAMYVGDAIVVLIAAFNAPFSTTWLLPLLFTCWTGATYCMDARILWKNRHERERC